MLGVLVWIVVILLICFSVFGGSWLLPLYVLFVVVVGFYFGVKYSSNPQLSSSASFLRLNVLSSLN